MQQETDFSQLDHIASPIFVLDVRQPERPVYIAYNSFARGLSGRPLSEYLGRTALEIYQSAHGRTVFDRQCQVAQSGQPVDYPQDLLIAGRQRSFQTTLTPIKDDSGAVVQLYGCARDTTEEQRAREAQVSLGTLSAEIEQFVSIAARDLRTPMRNVAMLANLLRENFVDHGDGKLQLIDTLEQMTGKSMSLITDVLAHARAAVPEARIEQFSFPSLCRDICDVLDPQTRHVVTYGASRIAADRTALQIVLRSFLDNAMEQGGDDRLKIDILVKQRAIGMLDFTLISTDSAFPNLSPSFLDQRARQPGNGCALFGVRRLINARGGQVEITLPEGGGGTISFTLPGVIVTDQAALATPTAAAMPAEQQIVALSGLLAELRG
ncbi:PAS domain-containing protein [Sulfitobacter aestuarii]|uniref:histidine kinase n=1 Tax=Sulfitobacter aestuarii TaxID=2161676 RepID=A0ABW5TZL4_9RHOB